MLIERVKYSARCWPQTGLKSVSGLRRLEKTLNILRCIHVIDLGLNYGSDIKEGNWLQLLFYFNVMMGMVAAFIRMSFFKLCSGF